MFFIHSCVRKGFILAKAGALIIISPSLALISDANAGRHDILSDQMGEISMKNNRVLGGLVAVAMGFGLTGPAFAEVVDLYAELGGDGTTATGEFNGTLDTDTLELTWTVSYEGLSGQLIGAHIHGPAQPGENAGILIGFEGIETSPFSGSEVIEESVISEILAGLYYANLHTEANPGGEIRGHIMRVDTAMMN